ncbi:unnamed protein product, partial [Rotaria socialis]
YRLIVSHGDDHIVRNKFTCLCKGSFYGSRCENSKSEIDVNVDEETFEQTTAMFIHFITVFENVQHQRITTLKKMKYDESTIELFVTHSFHIVIGELLNKSYYLLVSREASIESEYIQTEFLPNHRCIFVRELLNKTFRSYPRLRRIKYYPLLCRKNQQLKCFYEENYMCICDLDRFSNCFTFHHSSTYNCQDHNDCENGGQYFQGNATCPSVIGLFCHLSFFLDMTLQVLLTSNDWLDACVSVERIFAVIKRVNFDKPHLHIRLHRQLIDDNDLVEQRTWCFVRCSYSINIFNSFIILCHFLIPFTINLISTIFIIIFIARSRFNLQPGITFTQHLELKFKQNKHHFIASCALVLLALPPLITSLTRGCMKTPRNSWLFLFGYLISFLSSTIKFFAYILPWKIYKDEFKNVMKTSMRTLRMTNIRKHLFHDLTGLN